MSEFADRRRSLTDLWGEMRATPEPAEERLARAIEIDAAVHAPAPAYPAEWVPAHEAEQGRAR